MNVVGGNLNRPLSMADMDKALEDIELLLKEHWSVFHDLCFIEKWESCTKLKFKLRYPEKVTIKNYVLIAEMVASAVNGAYTFLAVLTGQGQHQRPERDHL